MPDKSNAPVIIIKKIEESGAHAHHGGGWKVAYADFMTAMMAFFLLLWILAASDEEKLRGLANYFTPTVSDTGKAAGDGSDLRPMISPGALVDGGPAEGGTKGPSFGEGSPLRAFDSRMRDVTPEVVVEYASPDEMPDAPPGPDDTASPDAEAELAQMREEIAERLAAQDMPELSDSVIVRQDGNGVVVEVVDVERRSLFERGRSDILPDARALMLAIGASLREGRGAIQIIGHTDAAIYGTDAGYSNWELSTDRANITRRLMAEAGIAPERIGGVSGVAVKTEMYALAFRVMAQLGKGGIRYQS